MSDVEANETSLLRQQDIFAKFGELALGSDDLDEILTEVCRLVGKALMPNPAIISSRLQCGQHRVGRSSADSEKLAEIIDVLG